MLNGRRKNSLLPRQWMALPYQLSMLSPVATLSASTPAQRAIAAAISSSGTLSPSCRGGAGTSIIGGAADQKSPLDQGRTRSQSDPGCVKIPKGRSRRGILFYRRRGLYFIFPSLVMKLARRQK